MQNSGNEAKKWLKTKDITFSVMQIMRVLRANLHQLNAKKSKNSAHCAERS